MRLGQLSSTLRKKSTRRMCFLSATFLIGTLALVSFTGAGTVDARHAPEFSANIPSQMSANMATSPKHTLIDPIKGHSGKKGKKPAPKATPGVTVTPYQDTSTPTPTPQSWPTETPTPGNASTHAATTTTAQPPTVPKLPQTGSDPGSNRLP